MTDSTEEFKKKMAAMVENLASGIPPVLAPPTPRAKQGRFDGLPPKYKRNEIPDQCLRAFEGLRADADGWLAGKNNWVGLLLHGGMGYGKTGVTAQFGWLFQDAGRHAQFEMLIDIVDSFKDLWRSGDNSGISEHDLVNKYATSDLLILDDVGIQFESQAERIILYKILVRRDNYCRPSILTTNINLNIESGQKEFFACVGHQVADRWKTHAVDCAQWGGNIR